MSSFASAPAADIEVTVNSSGPSVLAVDEKREWLANAFQQRLAKKEDEIVPVQHEWIDEGFDRKKYAEHELGLLRNQDAKRLAERQMKLILEHKSSNPIQDPEDCYTQQIEPMILEEKRSDEVQEHETETDRETVDDQGNNNKAIETQVFFTGDVEEISIENLPASKPLPSPVELTLFFKLAPKTAQNDVALTNSTLKTIQSTTADLAIDKISKPTMDEEIPHCGEVQTCTMQFVPDTSCPSKDNELESFKPDTSPEPNSVSKDSANEQVQETAKSEQLPEMEPKVESYPVEDPVDDDVKDTTTLENRHEIFSEPALEAGNDQDDQKESMLLNQEERSDNFCDTFINLCSETQEILSRTENYIAQIEERNGCIKEEEPTTIGPECNPSSGATTSNESGKLLLVTDILEESNKSNQTRLMENSELTTLDPHPPSDTMSSLLSLPETNNEKMPTDKGPVTEELIFLADNVTVNDDDGQIVEPIVLDPLSDVVHEATPTGTKHINENSLELDNVVEAKANNDDKPIAEPSNGNWRDNNSCCLLETIVKEEINEWFGSTGNNVVNEEEPVEGNEDKSSEKRANPKEIERIDDAPSVLDEPADVVLSLLSAPTDEKITTEHALISAETKANDDDEKICNNIVNEEIIVQEKTKGSEITAKSNERISADAIAETDASPKLEQSDTVTEFFKELLSPEIVLSRHSSVSMDNDPKLEDNKASAIDENATAEAMEVSNENAYQQQELSIIEGHGCCGVTSLVLDNVYSIFTGETELVNEKQHFDNSESETGTASKAGIDKNELEVVPDKLFSKEETHEDTQEYPAVYLVSLTEDDAAASKSNANKELQDSNDNERFHKKTEHEQKNVDEAANVEHPVEWKLQLYSESLLVVDDHSRNDDQKVVQEEEDVVKTEVSNNKSRSIVYIKQEQEDVGVNVHCMETCTLM